MRPETGEVGQYHEALLLDPSYVLPRFLTLLEQLIGDRWLFDRTSLLGQGGAASS